MPAAFSHSMSELKAYQPFHAARAELLSRMGHFKEAAAAYAMAIDLAGSGADAAFLRRRVELLARQLRQT